MKNIASLALAFTFVAALSVGTPTTGWAQSDDDIVVGFAAATSGWMMPFSWPPAIAAKMRIEEINAAGGLLGKQIQIAVADAKSDRTEGAKAGIAVIGMGADIVIVDCDFDMGAPAAMQAQNAGIISFSLCAGDPKMGIEGVGIYAFSGGNAAQVDGAAAATWAYERRGARKAYVLLDDTIEYDKSTCVGWNWAWDQLDGAKTVGWDVFQNGDPSIAPQIDRLKTVSEKPDVIAICSYPPGGASAIRQIRAAGIDTLILTGVAFDGTYWHDAVPDLSNFCVATFGAVSGDIQPEVAQFVQDYTDKAGEPPPSAFPLTGYSLIQLWSRAVERAGTVETKAVVAELEKMSGEDTLIGPRSFTSELHIQDTARYAMMCAEKGILSFQEYWSAGPVPKDVLMKN